MKKFILAICFVAIMITNCLASFGGEFFYQFIGKRVYIDTIDHSYYIGVLQTVLEVRTCKQNDQYGNCIREERSYFLFVKEADGKTVIINSKRVSGLEYEQEV